MSILEWNHDEPFDQPLLVYLSKSLKEDLRGLARMRGLTMAGLIRQTLADRLLAEQVRRRE